MKVECAEDCDNAPKKRLLRDLCIDYWRDEGSLVVEHLAEGAVWNIVGQACHVGVQAIRRQIEKVCDVKPAVLHIHNIITHGNTAAANATVTMRDGRQIEYCDVYQFAGFGPKAKIKEVTTYVIQVESR